MQREFKNSEISAHVLSVCNTTPRHKSDNLRWRISNAADDLFSPGYIDEDHSSDILSCGYIDTPASRPGLSINSSAARDLEFLKKTKKSHNDTPEPYVTLYSNCSPKSNCRHSATSFQNRYLTSPASNNHNSFQQQNDANDTCIQTLPFPRPACNNRSGRTNYKWRMSVVTMPGLALGGMETNYNDNRINHICIDSTTSDLQLSPDSLISQCDCGDAHHPYPIKTSIQPIHNISNHPIPTNHPTNHSTNHPTNHPNHDPRLYPPSCYYHDSPSRISNAAVGSRDIYPSQQRCICDGDGWIADLKNDIHNRNGVNISNDVNNRDDVNYRDDVGLRHILDQGQTSIRTSRTPMATNVHMTFPPTFVDRRITPLCEKDVRRPLDRPFVFGNEYKRKKHLLSRNSAAGFVDKWRRAFENRCLSPNFIEGDENVNSVGHRSCTPPTINVGGDGSSSCSRMRSRGGSGRTDCDVCGMSSYDSVSGGSCSGYDGESGKSFNASCKGRNRISSNSHLSLEQDTVSYDDVTNADSHLYQCSMTDNSTSPLQRIKSYSPSSSSYPILESRIPTLLPMSHDTHLSYNKWVMDEKKKRCCKGKLTVLCSTTVPSFAEAGADTSDNNLINPRSRTSPIPKNISRAVASLPKLPRPQTAPTISGPCDSRGVDNADRYSIMSMPLLNRDGKDDVGVNSGGIDDEGEETSDLVKGDLLKSDCVKDDFRVANDSRVSGGDVKGVKVNEGRRDAVLDESTLDSDTINDNNLTMVEDVRNGTMFQDAKSKTSVEKRESVETVSQVEVVSLNLVRHKDTRRTWDGSKIYDNDSVHEDTNCVFEEDTRFKRTSKSNDLSGAANKSRQASSFKAQRTYNLRNQRQLTEEKNNVNGFVNEECVEIESETNESSSGHAGVNVENLETADDSTNDCGGQQQYLKDINKVSRRSNKSVVSNKSRQSRTSTRINDKLKQGKDSSKEESLNSQYVDDVSVGQEASDMSYTNPFEIDNTRAQVDSIAACDSRRASSVVMTCDDNSPWITPRPVTANRYKNDEMSRSVDPEYSVQVALVENMQSSPMPCNVDVLEKVNQVEPRQHIVDVDNSEIDKRKKKQRDAKSFGCQVELEEEYSDCKPGNLTKKPRKYNRLQKKKVATRGNSKVVRHSLKPVESVKRVGSISDDKSNASNRTYPKRNRIEPLKWWCNEAFQWHRAKNANAPSVIAVYRREDVLCGIDMPTANAIETDKRTDKSSKSKVVRGSRKGKLKILDTGQGACEMDAEEVRNGTVKKNGKSVKAGSCVLTKSDEKTQLSDNHNRTSSPADEMIVDKSENSRIALKKKRRSRSETSSDKHSDIVEPSQIEADFKKATSRYSHNSTTRSSTRHSDREDSTKLPSTSAKTKSLNNINNDVHTNSTQVAPMKTEERMTISEPEHTGSIADHELCVVMRSSDLSWSEVATSDNKFYWAALVFETDQFTTCDLLIPPDTTKDLDTSGGNWFFWTVLQADKEAVEVQIGQNTPKRFSANDRFIVPAHGSYVITNVSEKVACHLHLVIVPISSSSSSNAS